MKRCLSEKAFQALLSDSGSAEQVTRWKRHLRECDSCATHFIQLQTGKKDFKKVSTQKANNKNNINLNHIEGRLEPNVQIGDFVIGRRLGSGGMGTVYQACQKSLNRQVALKVMSAGLITTDEAVSRFHREARAAAKLHHTNIVAIYAEGQEDQTCYYAMELIRGQTLEQIINNFRNGRSHKIKTVLSSKFYVSDTQEDSGSSGSSVLKSRTSLEHPESYREHFDSIARLIADVADALDYAHKNGIIHRDIKPSNLILGINGRINLMDFGLARMLEEQSVTVTGSFIGTPRYMSPEQIKGTKQRIDHRTDIYSLGVTLYELLTLEIPYSGETREQVVTQILSKELLRPRKIDSRIPRDLETICCKAMEKDVRERYQNAGQMAEDLRRYVNRYAITAKKAGSVERAVKFVRRHKVLSALVAGIAVMAAVVVFTGWKYFTNQWVQKTAIPNIRRLVDEGLYLEAFDVAKKTQRFAPNDPRLNSLLEEFTKTASIYTIPYGADIYVKPYNSPAESWTKLGKSPIIKVNLAQELYRWRIVKSGYTPLEFRWPVDETLSFTLESVDRTPSGMVRVGGGTFNLTLNGMNHFTIDLPDFYIDRCEITNEEYKSFIVEGGYENEEYWKQPIIIDGQTVSWSDAMKHFKDSTGRSGPADWVNGDYPEGRGNHPVGGISWYEAAAYAEFVGKQLPTIYHWSRAGITLGTYAGTVLLFSNFDDEGIAPINQYDSLGNYGTYDMAGNVREWCWNLAEEGKRYILGGAWNNPQYTFTTPIKFDPYDRSLENGFRCIKSLPKNKIPAKAYEPVATQIRDYDKETPIPKEEFLIYKQTLYSYDKSDLNPVTITIDDSQEYWVHEIISFDAAYGDERMTAHLYLPSNASPPYQVVIYFPGNSALFLREYYSRGLPKFLLRSGRAVIYPIYKGTYERNTGLPSNRPNASQTYRDHVIWWAKDVSRAIDYLELRDDIQNDKIGYYGLSWGAIMGSIVPAVEERIKACALVGGAFYFERSRPEVDQINFVSYIKVPVLMLNGEYDSALPVDLSQLPMFNLLGTPDEHKRHVLIKGGHLPTERINQETLDWFDRYFGPVELNTNQ